MENFWAIRAKGYNNLQWANNNILLEGMRTQGKFKYNHDLLDVGCGTGMVAKYLAKDVNSIIGIDTSKEMLASANGSMPQNVRLQFGDVRDNGFRDGQFDGITARYAFHHFVGFAQEAMNNCFGMLNQKGTMVVCEGTPPDAQTRNWYTDIFKLKEERITVYEQDVISWMYEAGFKCIGIRPYILRRMSIRNWLNSSGLPEDIKTEIYHRHIYAPLEVKDSYNMVTENNDCFIDMRNVIITGTK
jgi:ubiquinone/menaquinone biosynthesis C-methylase UbiE